ncbi:NACHT domain-containing protein [Micromonospora carbonacea]|uniref:NACHT domain-containing protein n=1 Tax=Micromonospora carbonacea TaxID=47853 RepID=UPI00371E8659
MRRILSKVRHQPLVPYVVTAAVVAAGWVIWRSDLETADRVASVGSFTVAAATLLLAVWGGRARRPARSLDEHQGALRAAVRQQWRVEEALRRVQDPMPIPVRWEALPAGLGGQDHWANVGLAAAGATAVEMAVAGRLPEAAAVFRRIPSRRLVVLGPAGGGKSVLLIRLVLDLIAAGGPGEPVPMLLSVTSWDPGRAGFADWLVARLAADYPALAAGHPDFGTVAAALLAEERVLPVLDGLDELPAAARPAALLALNAASPGLPGVVVASRTAQYLDAVRGGDVLTGAAVVRLLPLGVADLAAYLPRTARPTGRASATAWEPVLARLAGAPADDRARLVGGVLATPLMTSLARAAYSDTGADPAALLDAGRFGTADDLAGHLLDRAVPVAYTEHAGGAAARTAARVVPWLAWLAAHAGPDIAWWRLSAVVPRAVPAVAGGVFGAVALGVVAGAAGGGVAAVLGAAVGAVVSGFVMVRQPLVPTGLPADDGGGAGWHRQAARLLRTGGVASGPPAPGRGVVTPGLVGWVTGGAAIVAAGWLSGGGAAAVAAAGALLLALFLDAWLDVPTDVTAAAGPLAVLRADRRTALAKAVVRGGILGVTTAALIDAGTGLAVAAATAGASVLFTAWGRFGVARAWFAVRGELPWRLLAFLDDAHRRGVLRQIGGVYQFRHARLRERLLVPRPEPVSSRGA